MTVRKRNWIYFVQSRSLRKRFTFGMLRVYLPYMKRILASIFGRPSAVAHPTSTFGAPAAPKTFGEARAQKMEQRLQSSIKERQTLARAQAATVDPLQTHIKDRGAVVAGRIDRLRQQIADTK